MRHLKLTSLLAPFALLLAACDGTKETTPTPTPGDPCADKIAECRVTQKACVSDASGAHCEACPPGKYAAESGSCAAIEGTAYSHDFTEFTVKPGEEVLGQCQSWTINNPEEIWFNAVELVQDEASHHSNWMFVPDDKFDGPDGVWKCSDRSYSQLTAALAGGVLYAQSTQATKEVQKFPGGAAVRIPPYSRIISDIHLLNVGSTAVTGHAHLNIYGLPVGDVKVKLTPFHLSYEGLAIPPHATSRFVGECHVGAQFLGAVGTGFEMKVYYALPHTHAMATRFFTEILGGSRDGESIIDVAGFNGEARGRSYDPPIDMKGSQGFRFGCEYVNERSVEVDWGFGDQEMCEVLGFAESRAGFESIVDSAKPAPADGKTEVFTGPCANTVFEWTNDKPGGPGPK
jgi:hypothetical protein